MKKTVLLTLLLVGMAANAFAAKTFTSTTGSSLGSTTFKTSTSVTLIATGDTAGYNVASKHTQGDRIYKSASNDANITEDSTSTSAAKGQDITSTDVPTTYVIP